MQLQNLITEMVTLKVQHVGKQAMNKTMKECKLAVKGLEVRKNILEAK